MKADSPPPVAIVGGSDPTSANRSRRKEGGRVHGYVPHRRATDLSLLSSIQQPQQLSVRYQVAENGHTVYFQVIDQQSGQVILADAALCGAEQ